MIYCNIKPIWNLKTACCCELLAGFILDQENRSRPRKHQDHYQEICKKSQKVRNFQNQNISPAGLNKHISRKERLPDSLNWSINLNLVSLTCYKLVSQITKIYLVEETNRHLAHNPYEEEKNSKWLAKMM